MPCSGSDGSCDKLGQSRYETMGFARTAGLGLMASAATITARKATRSLMHTRHGAPRLPRAARRNNGVAMILTLAAGACLVAYAYVVSRRSARAEQSAVSA